METIRGEDDEEEPNNFWNLFNTKMVFKKGLVWLDELEK